MMSSKNILVDGDDFTFYLDALDFDQEQEIVYLALDDPKEFGLARNGNTNLQVEFGLPYSVMDELASVWANERAPAKLNQLLQASPAEDLTYTTQEERRKNTNET